MAKRKLTRDEIERSIELAFEELLELSTMELQSQSFEFEEENKNKEYIKEKPVQSNKTIQPIEVNSKTSQLKEIINLAKIKGNQINDGKWKDYDPSKEEAIISKAKQEGKSAYDSDVLREIILERQKQKRKTNDITNVILKPKK